MGEIDWDVDFFHKQHFKISALTCNDSLLYTINAMNQISLRCPITADVSVVSPPTDRTSTSQNLLDKNSSLLCDIKGCPNILHNQVSRICISFFFICGFLCWNRLCQKINRGTIHDWFSKKLCLFLAPTGISSCRKQVECGISEYFQQPCTCYCKIISQRCRFITYGSLTFVRNQHHYSQYSLAENTNLI